MNLIDYMGANTDGQFLERLQQEVQAWEQEGTITPEQGRAILSRYPADSSVGAVRRRHSLVVGISVLGAVLVGLGIISFFAANWDDISRSVRLGMLIAGVILSYGAGFLLWQRLGYTALGLALVLLGCIIFGAGVHLIGQIYNVPVDHPNLTAFWFLGVAPLAYATRSRPIMALAVALFLVAVAFRIAHWDRFTGEIQTVGYFALYLGLGLAIYAVGRAKQQLPGWEQMGSVFRAIGVVVALGALYLMTFLELHEESREVVGPGYRYWVLAYAASAVAVASLAWSVWQIRLSPTESPAEYVELAAVVLLLAASLLVVNVPSQEAAVYTIVFNVLLALCALGMMVSGYLQESEVRINLSMGLIALFLISRYFEFSIQLLDGALVFVGAGVILLAGGFLLERGRRRMLEAMRREEAGR